MLEVVEGEGEGDGESVGVVEAVEVRLGVRDGRGDRVADGNVGISLALSSEASCPAVLQADDASNIAISAIPTRQESGIPTWRVLFIGFSAAYFTMPGRKCQGRVTPGTG